MRVENFEDEREWRRVETVEEIAASVWKEGKHTVFTPHDDDEADHVFGVVAAGRNVVLVVDEVHTYLSPHYLSPQLGELLRGHRHFNVRNHVTTQRIGDVPQRAFGQAPRIFVFRNVARSDLKRIESDYSIPEHVTATIPQFHFIEIYQGFE